MGKHRKLMPTAAERLIWGQGDGSTMPVFDTPIGRLGAVICWENYMPMLRMHMYARGIQLYCAPTADDRETWLSTMRHIALEGRCFVLGCNQFARRSDYPADYPAIQGDDPATVMSRGGSCIVDPLGRVLAGPAFDGPVILAADLDLDEVARVSSTSTSPDTTPVLTSSASWSTRRRHRSSCESRDELPSDHRDPLRQSTVWSDAGLRRCRRRVAAEQ